MEESAEQIPLPPRSGGAPGHPFVRPATPIAQDDVRYGLAYLQQRLDEARDADSKPTVSQTVNCVYVST